MIPELQAFVDQAIEARAAALETACEQAVQSGALGVLVVDGYKPLVTHLVPYGELYEFPSMASMQAFLDLSLPNLGTPDA